MDDDKFSFFSTAYSMKNDTSLKHTNANENILI